MKVLLLSLSISLLAAGSPVTFGQNLLENPGFEEGRYEVKAIPRGWYAMRELETATYRWEEESGREGSKCVYLADGRVKTGLGFPSIGVEAKRAYRLGGWVRTKGLADGQLWLRVVVGGEGLAGQHFIIRVPASEEWTHVSTPVVDLEPGTVLASVMVQIRPDATGEAWIDYVFFGEAERVPFESPYPVPPLSGERPDRRLRATGFFRVEQVDGVWWLVTPKGELFWSTGSNSTGDVNPVLLENLTARLAEGEGRDAQREYLEEQLERARAWGFNSLGGWSRLTHGDFSVFEFPSSRASTPSLPTSTHTPNTASRSPTTTAARRSSGSLR